MPRSVLHCLALTALLLASCAAPQGAARVEFNKNEIGDTLPEPFDAWPNREWADVVFAVSHLAPFEEVRFDLLIRRDDGDELVWKDQPISSAYNIALRAERDPKWKDDPELKAELVRLTRTCVVRCKPGKCRIVFRMKEWPERELEIELKGGERAGYMVAITGLGPMIMSADELKE